MSDIAIRVENLGKQYHIGALQHEGGLHTYKSLRESIARAATAPFRGILALAGQNGKQEKTSDSTIWALKDVSFEVKRGEILGVIGRNGAGKSTLLKVLSRITEPTAGYAEIHGRTGSLLEVGTGFHPELTGRDNIYLNGSILGMKRAEIARQFDEIVAFAEVEKFIDTPVKHYSSGMYLRLAFAVAAHLKTEVLLVDEVLAVGDYKFQEKCLGKMQDVATTGRTVLLVSHSMSAVQRLCKRALAFDDGKLIADSSPESVIAEYIGGNLGSTYTESPNDAGPTIVNAELVLKDRALLLSVEFRSPFALTSPVLSFAMYNSVGTPVFGTDSFAEPISPPPEPAMAGRFEVAIPADNFRPDRYMFTLWLCDYYTVYCTRELALQVNINGNLGGGPSTQYYGSIYLPTHWSYKAMDGERTI
jgi:lipopolysaccharide transport system ATP-binding protein